MLGTRDMATFWLEVQLALTPFAFSPQVLYKRKAIEYLQNPESVRHTPNSEVHSLHTIAITDGLEC
jgi:hypothetical protein